MPHPFPRPLPFNIQVKRSATGLGLYAAQDIPRGKFVIEYWGELMTDDEANSRGGKYLFQLGNGKTIDGMTRKNTARYINHSCKPNCEVDTPGNRIYIKTCKKISAGEELTYDYSTEYWEAYIKPYGCRCAACAKKKAKK